MAKILERTLTFPTEITLFSKNINFFGEKVRISINQEQEYLFGEVVNDSIRYKLRIERYSTEKSKK